LIFVSVPRVIPLASSWQRSFARHAGISEIKQIVSGAKAANGHTKS
jgi:hypothetical protein